MLWNKVYICISFFLFCEKLGITLAVIPHFIKPAWDGWKCELKSPTHLKWNSSNYFLSWRADLSPLKGMKVTLPWEEARKFCQVRCMDLVSLETQEENNFLKSHIVSDGQHFMWTSGRRCQHMECSENLKLHGTMFDWYWAGSGVRLPNRVETDWSHTGGLGAPQPDNREGVQGGEDEACLAVLNGVHGPGARWHDVGCHHALPFACERTEPRDQVSTSTSTATSEEALEHSVRFPATVTSALNTGNLDSRIEPEPEPPALVTIPSANMEFIALLSPAPASAPASISHQ